MSLQPFFIVLLLSFCSICCKQSNQYFIETKKISSQKSITILKDSTYIYSAQCMRLDSNKLFLLDNHRSEVIVMDKELNLLNTIGREGRGPREFFDASSFILIGRDTVIINDPGNNRLQMYYSNGSHIKSISRKNISAKLDLGFQYVNKVLTATSYGEKAIVMYRFHEDGSPKKIKEFGNRYSFNNAKQNAIRNDRYLHHYEETVIAISDNQPIIEIYGNTGNLLRAYNFSKIDVVDKQLKYISNKKHSENSYMVLVEQTYLLDDQLYVLINRNLPEYTSNTIISFNLKPKISPSKIYHLPNNIYQAFAVDKAHIYAYGENPGLQKLKK